MFSKNSTDLDWLDKLLSFCINKKVFIEFGDDVNPLFIIYAVKNKTIENDFLIVSEIENVQNTDLNFIEMEKINLK